MKVLHFCEELVAPLKYRDNELLRILLKKYSVTAQVYTVA